LRLVVLLPAFNEGPSIESLILKVYESARKVTEDVKVIVCDDGSSDTTPEILSAISKHLPVEVITHKLNRGLGETIRDLIERACEITDPPDVIVRLDADATHEPMYFLEMYRALDGGADIVVASRFATGGGQIGVPRYRELLSRGANIFMRIVFRIDGLREFSSGFRMYRADILQRAVALYGNNFIQIKGLGFTCTLEKLVKLNMIGARFVEVPFVLRYDRKVSSSKMVSSVTTLGYLVLAVMYHWPFGGWRSQARRRSVNRLDPNDPISFST